MGAEEHNTWNNIFILKKIKVIVILIYIITSFFILKYIIIGKISPILYFIDDRPNRIIVSALLMGVFLITLLNIIINLFDFRIEENRNKIKLMYRRWEIEIDELLKNDLSIDILLNLYPGYTRNQKFRIEEMIKNNKEGNSFKVFKKLFTNPRYEKKLFNLIDPTNIARDMDGIEEIIKIARGKSYLYKTSYENEIKMIREFAEKSISLMDTIELIKLYLMVNIKNVFHQKDYKRLERDILRKINNSNVPIYKILKEMRPYHHGFFNKTYCRASSLVVEKFEKDLLKINSEEEFNKILAELFDNEKFKELVIERKEIFLSKQGKTIKNKNYGN